jgi:putative membrane protein (TIGR04086 family)
VRKIKRGSALLLGAGTSIFLVFIGMILAAIYVLFSSKGTYFLSSYFTIVLFLSVFCGGYVAGHKGGIRNWVPAGLIGVCTGGLALTLIYMLFPVAPGVRELLALLLLPAFFSSTGALAAVNRGRKQQLTRNLGA